MFNGHIFIDGNIVLNFLVEEGICTEDAECNLRVTSYFKGSYDKQKMQNVTLGLNPILKGHMINRILHSLSFHVRFMKLAKGSFHKFHMK